MIVKENLMTKSIEGLQAIGYDNSQMITVGDRPFSDGTYGLGFTINGDISTYTTPLRGYLNIYKDFSEPLIKGEKYYIRFKVKNRGDGILNNAIIRTRVLNGEDDISLNFGEERTVELYGEKTFDNYYEQIQMLNADPSRLGNLFINFSDIQIVKGEKPDMIIPSNANVGNNTFSIGGGNYSPIKSI